MRLQIVAAADRGGNREALVVLDLEGRISRVPPLRPPELRARRPMEHRNAPREDVGTAPAGQMGYANPAEFPITPVA